MTFSFDGGDILIILLVAIAFVLFRRFDRTGRSLEKVRRYAEKSKNELDLIVAERELRLRDLTVDLEVQEQTNREILSRAEAARTHILSRTEELEDRVAHIETHERALEELNDLAVRVDENLSRLKDESVYVDTVGTRLNEVRKIFSTLNHKDEERFQKFRSEAIDRFASQIEAIQHGVENASQQLDQYQKKIVRLDSGYNDVIKTKKESFRADLESVEAVFREKLQKVAEEGVQLEDEAFNALNVKIDSRTERLEENWLNGLNELKDRVSSTALEIQEMLSDAHQRMESADGDFRSVEERMLSTTSRMDNEIHALCERVDRFAENTEVELLEKVEGRQNAYRNIIESRFGRLDEFIKDMDTLAESLRLSQEQNIKEVEVVFEKFDAQMLQRRKDDEVRYHEDAVRIREEMDALEQGLNDLKSRAYDNVSEKLQVFEDEFIADLKNRSAEMESALDHWRKDADLQITDLGLKAGREREETERHYSTELKQKLSELQSRVFGQFEIFQNQVDGFRDSLSGRILVAEEEIASLRQNLSNKIIKEKNAAVEEFERTFRAFESETEEKIAKGGKRVSLQFADFSRDIESHRKELSEDFQSTKDDVSEWKERIESYVAEAEHISRNGIDTLRSDFAAKISEIQDEYTSRTEQLILESGEERTELRRSIGELEESLSNVSTAFKERSRDALDELKEHGENFLLEFRKNSRESREEVERKVKELRNSVQESREKAENNRKEMAAHTDTEYARLMKNLDEIDRRQREFIAETRVFERADEMKERLEADIVELNRQLDAVGVGREEIRSINEEYEKAANLYDEVSGKMDRFLSEYQKVENLEGKISRIGSLSESVELKLGWVSDANDTLRDLQIRMKQLEDLHEDIGTRYERLSEKSVILDTTTEGVDRSFERMAQVESLVKDLADRLVPLQHNLETSEERQVRLEEDREKINAVTEKVASLDGAIVELDRRLEELSKAREWLARTETRLEEINAETQQHVRLLNTLAKRDGRKTQGSPDMSTREMVVKLARQGWNSEEIARNTKLSRGEVELILELTPHK